MLHGQSRNEQGSYGLNEASASASYSCRRARESKCCLFCNAGVPRNAEAAIRERAARIDDIEEPARDASAEWSGRTPRFGRSGRGDGSVSLGFARQPRIERTTLARDDAGAAGGVVPPWRRCTGCGCFAHAPRSLAIVLGRTARCHHRRRGRFRARVHAMESREARREFTSPAAAASVPACQRADARSWGSSARLASARRGAREDRERVIDLPRRAISCASGRRPYGLQQALSTSRRCSPCGGGRRICRVTASQGARAGAKARQSFSAARHAIE